MWVFFSLFVWKNIVSCSIESFMVRYYHFFFGCNLGALHDWLCWRMLVLEHSWSVIFFFYHGAILGNFGGLWNFDNVGTLWCCWMNFGLNFGSIGMVKNLCCRFGWICSWCMWEKFVGMSKLCFMDMKKLCE